MERLEYINKLRILLSSTDQANYDLAFQIMCGQGMPQELAPLLRNHDHKIYLCFKHGFEQVVYDAQPEILQFRDQAIVDFQDKIYKFYWLKALRMYNTELRQFPHKFHYLRELIELISQDNPLENIPEEMGELKQLITLSIRKSQIQTLPSSVGQLKNLRTLLVGNNQLRSLPSEIAQIFGLLRLEISHNPINFLPAEISQWLSLNTLYAVKTQLTSLDEICQLTHLSILDLSGSPIQNFPPEMSQLKNLVHLGLGSMHLNKLPEVIPQLPKLNTLILINNAFSDAEKQRIQEALPTCTVYF